MEQKKTLWIIAASGAFLLVVIGAALILNSPTATQTPAVASITTVELPKSSSEFSKTSTVLEPLPSIENRDVVENLASATPILENTDANTTQKVDTVTVISGTTNVYADPNSTTTIDLNVNRNQPSESVSATSEAGANALAYTKTANGNAKGHEVKKVEQVAKVAKPSYSVVVSKKAPSKQAATKTTSAKQAPAQTVAQQNYWVQAASFQNKKSADAARTTLGENGIPTEVFTYKDGENKVFYRVRVGPYITKSEAEYWQSRICMIDTFKKTESYITENISYN